MSAPSVIRQGGDGTELFGEGSKGANARTDGLR